MPLLPLYRWLGPVLNMKLFCVEGSTAPWEPRPVVGRWVGYGWLIDHLLPVKAHTGEYSVTEHPIVKIDLVIKSEILYYFMGQILFSVILGVELHFIKGMPAF